MIKKLFVYGTLAPGRSNEHILKNIGGLFGTASVRGVLHPEGWGYTMGYPGLILKSDGDRIDGFLFTSENISALG